MPPFSPALGKLRIASLNDLPRIGVVAASGFRYTSVFIWERPYHESYPQDTLLSYRHKFREAILDQQYVVHVAEDRYRLDERDESTDVIPCEDGVSPRAPGETVVVGVACWKLQPGSPSIGEYQDHNGIDLER